MARTPAPGTRERILDSADRLFYEKGVHAVGLQEVVDDCGCGKNLLYREFASKDDLVGAYLERRHQQWLEQVDEALTPLTGDPGQQIIALVRIVASHVSAPEYCGCPFLRAHGEHADGPHPAREVPIAHVQELSDQLHVLAKRARLRRPRAVADRILLIIEGLYATGAVLGAGVVRSALDFAEDVVRDAAPGRDRSV